MALCSLCVMAWSLLWRCMDMKQWGKLWLIWEKSFLEEAVLHCLKEYVKDMVDGEGRQCSRRMCAHLLLWECQNYNSLLNNCWQKKVGSCQKKMPHVQGQRRSPRNMVGGAKLYLESNTIPTRDPWRAQTNPVCTRTQRPPQGLSQNSVWVSPAEVRVSSGLPQGQGLCGATGLGMA